ncbi:hypothetical protein PIB30_066253 [Stylosanthes scabra]|uniref:Uncharacterized protein n=1 Tax=Stylosanthes scabra TaxID=79078 RepID=A0ABU6ZL19_9FABA|nr:hypothetical protein [Stylosanthes scabra]
MITPPSPPSTHNHHEPPSLYILIINRSSSHPSSIFYPRPIEKPPNISAVLPLFLSLIRKPNFCPLPFSALSPATFVHRGTPTSPPPSSSLCSLKRATTYEEQRHHQNSQLGASSAQNCFASVSFNKLSSLTGGLQRHLPRVLPPQQLVPLLGTLANHCSAHVFGKYPRRTPAKSTDTAFRGSKSKQQLRQEHKVRKVEDVLES